MIFKAIFDYSIVAYMSWLIGIIVEDMHKNPTKINTLGVMAIMLSVYVIVRYAVEAAKPLE
jgi:hypothetical protein